MYVESLSRTFLVGALTLLLTACGGGGGGGGGSILDPGTGSSSGGGSGGTGSITLSISGMVDKNGNEDSILAGNEFATLTAEVVEDGNAANVIVLFTTSIGRLVTDNAQSTGGTASVQITGDGTAGAATVTASATLTNGVEVSADIVVQMSSDAPNLVLLNASGAEATNVELRAAETATIRARVRDWDETPLAGVGVNFDLGFNGNDSMTASLTSGATDANGILEVVLTGTQESGTGTFTATANLSEFDLEDEFPINGLGVNSSLNNITLDTIDTGADGVLAGNEKTMVVARIVEDGVEKNGIVVQFDTKGTGGLLGNNGQTTASATTANDGTSNGVAMVRFVGDATAGTATVTATATLSNGIEVSNSSTVQTSEDGPTLTLEVRDAAGNVVTSFGTNQELSFEATVVDFDGGALDADDAGVNVTFTNGGLGTLSNASDVTEFAVCPVNGIKQNADCAFVLFTSSASAAVGTVSASATLNGISLADDVQLSNTGINSGTGDQDSFSITRKDEAGNVIAIGDVFAIEGDQFNGQFADIEVDLADFFNNPVPDGTKVEFRTELGDIDGSCTTVAGSCSVRFTSADPRTPIDSEVSFRNLNDDNCPSALVLNERVVVSGGVAATDYRVRTIKRVAQTGGVPLATNTYRATSSGIACLSAPCTNGTSLDITYDRLWLDEEDNAATTHLLNNPGEATEPFLALTGTPCLAPVRSKLELISGSINPAASITVTGVGTQFLLELAVGDRLKVGNEVRTITAIASNTSLTVDSAFTDGPNDVSPQRMAAAAYQGGMGQPYGAKSTILAFALGEESFVDVNGNKEYDYGETFFDLPEVFMDKNTDGVLGDVDGNSAAVASVGPYSSKGGGSDPVGGKRDKSSPYCYGPKTIVGDPAGTGSSTEQDTYCYQDGGEEEFFIDANANGVMDVGNGIYNGSRCLTPMQDADGDGVADELVCTTDLVNISAQVEILMAGSSGFFEFRTTEGGANGGGEVVAQVEQVGGTTIDDTSGSPTDWTINNNTAVGSITIQKGADVDNTGLGASRDVELFTIPNAFTTANATWRIEFFIEREPDGNKGPVEIFASGQLVTFDDGDAFCGELPNVNDTCLKTNLTVAQAGNLIIAASHATEVLNAEIKNFSITGVATGNELDYEIINGETVMSNRNTPGLTQFDVGDAVEIAEGGATTVFAGVSERLGNGGTVPVLSTTRTVLDVYHTDRYNGQLPDGTLIRVESDNSSGCTLASVNGEAVNSSDPGALTGGVHFGEVTVGSDVGISTRIALTSGFGEGPVTVFATTPSGTVRSKSIPCEL